MLTRRHFILLGGGAALGMNTCISGSSHINPHEPTDLEQLVTKATDCLAAGKFGEAQAILEPHYDEAKEDIGYRVFLSIAYAGNKNNGKAQTEFRNLINEFESGPEVITTVRDRLRPLFGADSYKKTRERLRGLAPMTFPVDLSDLWAVDGFLCLAEHKFDEARQAFGKIVTKYHHKLATYIGLMQKLVNDSKKRKDKIAEEGYNGMVFYFQKKLTPGLVNH